MRFQCRTLALAGVLAAGGSGLFATANGSPYAGVFLVITPRPFTVSGPVYAFDLTLTGLQAMASKHEVMQLDTSLGSHRNRFDLAVTENLNSPHDGQLLNFVLKDAGEEYVFSLFDIGSSTATSAPSGGFTYTFNSAGAVNGITDSSYTVSSVISFDGRLERDRGDGAPAYSAAYSAPSAYSPSVVSDTAQFDIAGPISTSGFSGSPTLTSIVNALF
jgi:hypothetical protein